MTTTPRSPERPGPPTRAPGTLGPPWVGPSDRSTHVLRWVILSLALALGLVLLVSGHLLIGGLVTALAVLRMVMVTKVGHRRRQVQEWRRIQRAERRSAPGR